MSWRKSRRVLVFCSFSLHLLTVTNWSNLSLALILHFLTSKFCIYHTRETIFYHISKYQGRVKNMTFDEQGFWKCGKIELSFQPELQPYNQPTNHDKFLCMFLFTVLALTIHLTIVVVVKHNSCLLLIEKLTNRRLLNILPLTGLWNSIKSIFLTLICAVDNITVWISDVICFLQIHLLQDAQSPGGSCKADVEWRCTSVWRHSALYECVLLLSCGARLWSHWNLWSRNCLQWYV